MENFKQPIRDPELSRRFLETMELFSTAVQIMRQNIRRREPGLSEEQVEERVQEWLLTPGDGFQSPQYRRSQRWNHLLGD